jgi:hypothetical protein
MALEQRIQSLRNRHAELDLQILAETARPVPDTVRLHQLKSEKLNTKDEMTRLVQMRSKQAA